MLLLVLIRTQRQNCRIAQTTQEDLQQKTDIAIDERQDVSIDVQAKPFDKPMTSSSNPVSNTNTEKHSLTDIMERFVPLETFDWSTDDELLPIHYLKTDLAASKRYWKRKYSFPQDIFLNSSVIRQKANNFMLMRSNLVIDVKVNADPFKAGSLLVAYYPRATENSYRTTANEFLASVTSAPHRILNLEESNSLQFEVPYANELDYINLTNDANQFGSIYIWPLTSLRGDSDSNSVSVVVRARFSDVSLDVPTNNSLEANRDYVGAEISRLQILLKNMKAQGSEGESSGPVSTISNAVGTIAECLEGVPLIGSIAKTVGWVSRGVANVASVFGFSKPVFLYPTKSVAQQPAKFMCNTEGQDNSVVLAQIADNAIDVSSSVPETADEMSLKYLLSKPNIFMRQQLNPDGFSKSSLFARWNVTPIGYHAVQGDQTLSLGSFGFTSAMALYWRGSIQYSITFIKTCFHSGRYIVVYFPNTTANNIPDTYDETMTTNLNMIFDLKEKNEGCESVEKMFTVPYSSEYPWKRTLQVANGKYITHSMTSCNGSVGIYALTDLVYPSTVTGTMDIIVKHKAGDDYELALPQLQMRSGYAEPEVDTPTYQFRKLMQNSYAGKSWKLSGNYDFGEEVPTLLTIDGSGTYVSASSSGESERYNSWPYAADPDNVIPEGYSTFVFPVTVVYDDREVPWTFEQSLIWDVYKDATGLSVTTKPLATFTGDFGGTATGTMIFDSFKAQGAEDTHDPLPQSLPVAPVNVKTGTALMTTGEYFHSLRGLLKRFCLIGSIQPGTWSYSPSVLKNSDSPQYYGVRSVEYSGSDVLLPESWLSMVSYLYRFYAGSTRTKLIGDNESTFKTWLRVKTSSDVETDTLVVDPVYSQVGNVNPVLETHIPFYGSTRAKVVGQELVGGYSAHQVFENSTPVDFYEAGGDDFSFWFVVGPPPMTAINTSSLNRERVLSLETPTFQTGVSVIPS